MRRRLHFAVFSFLVFGCDKGVTQDEHEALKLQLQQAKAELEAAKGALAACEHDEKQVVRAEGIEIELPGAQAGSEAETQVVALLTATQTSINGKVVDDAELDEMLRAAATADASTLIVTAEDTVPHATVVQLMDRAKAAGIRRIAMTKPTAPEPAPE